MNPAQIMLLLILSSTSANIHPTRNNDDNKQKLKAYAAGMKKNEWVYFSAQDLFPKKAKIKPKHQRKKPKTNN